MPYLGYNLLVVKEYYLDDYSKIALLEAWRLYQQTGCFS